jgi:hypothetical protein
MSHDKDGATATGSRHVKIVVQNLQKTSGLASQLVEEYAPDILLAQEVNKKGEPSQLFGDAFFTSRLGYGTAIYSSSGASCVRRVKSSKAELGGFIKKKTVVCTCSGIQCVTFHGYNGTPMRDVAGLVTHVKAVIDVLSPHQPAVFGGDFNTWTPAHLTAVSAELCAVGFHLALSWPYGDGDKLLDHVFLRGIELVSSSIFTNESDHRGAVLECTLIAGYSEATSSPPAAIGAVAGTDDETGKCAMQ